MIELPMIESGIEIGIIDVKTGSIDISHANSIRFTCDSRVDCCSKLKIPVTDFDVQRIESAGYDTFQIVESLSLIVLNNNLNIEKSVPVYTLKRKPFDGTCTFLENNLCKIHEVKPFACRSYPFSLDIIDQNRIKIIIHRDSVCKSIQSTSEVESNNHTVLQELLSMILNELDARGIQVID